MSLLSKFMSATFVDGSLTLQRVVHPNYYAMATPQPFCIVLRVAYAFLAVFSTDFNGSSVPCQAHTNPVLVDGSRRPSGMWRLPAGFICLQCTYQQFCCDMSHPTTQESLASHDVLVCRYGVVARFTSAPHECVFMRCIAIRPRICMDVSRRNATQRMTTASVCGGGQFKRSI